MVGHKQAGKVVWPTDRWFRDQTVPELADLEPPPTRFRLGIHFEKLYQSWIQASPDYDLLKANLQIQGDGRTLGEFDLLITCHEVHEHWELAIKFYINEKDPIDTGQWFGPDPADTLASKLNRFTTHQFPLASRPEATEQLDALDIQLHQARCIMKGRLYHPWQAYETGQFLTPEGVNPNHNRGWWLSLDQFDQLHQRHQLHGEKMVYLDKSLWLSELLAQDVDKTISATEAEAQIQASEQIALQFALLDKAGNEASRGFVLKPRWFELVDQASN